MKPTKPTDFAAMVPEKYRDHVVEKVGKQQKAREHNQKSQQRTAQQIDAMRAKHGRDEGAAALKADQQTKLSQQMIADKAREDERAVAAAQAQRGKQPSRRQRKADQWRARGERLKKRMRDHVLKYAAKLRELGQDDADPEPIGPDVHRIAELIGMDPTGHMARIHLAQLPRAKARQLMRAALHPEPYRGKRVQQGRELREPKQKMLDGNRKHWVKPGTRRWTHPVAIRTIAVACALWRQSKRTRRKGYARVVHGVPRQMICALAQDHDTGVRPCLNAIFGNLRGVPGAVRALERAGFFQVDQPPGSEVGPRDRGPSGHAFNCYWFPPYAPPRGEEPPLDEADEIERLAAAGLTPAEALGRAPPS